MPDSASNFTKHKGMMLDVTNAKAVSTVLISPSTFLPRCYAYCCVLYDNNVPKIRFALPQYCNILSIVSTMYYL